jgi:ribonuclease BN (tRNA processing enzyme)
VVIDGLSIVFSGDMSNKKNTLVKLADKADILIAHNAIPEKTKGIARNLHMPPSEIGRIASTAKVKQLILSHRMKRTIGNEDETSTQIRQSYQGALSFSDDMQCFSPRVTH